MKTYQHFDDIVPGHDTSPDFRMVLTIDSGRANLHPMIDSSALHVCWPSLNTSAPADDDMFAYGLCRNCGVAHFTVRHDGPG